MTILDLAENKRYAIKAQKVRDVKKEYLAKYRYHMFKLYDQGYIDEIGYFDKKKIMLNLKECNIRLAGVSGAIELSSASVRIAAEKECRREKPDKRIIWFLLELSRVLYYREQVLDLDRMYNDLNLQNNQRATLSLRYSWYGAYPELNHADYFGESILACTVDERYKVKRIPYMTVIYDIIAKELGIEDELKKGKSLYVKGISQDIEREYITAIVDGKVSLDGEYGRVLESYFISNRWGDENFSDEGFIQELCKKYEKEIEVLQTNQINKIEQDYEIIAMDSNNLYVIEKRKDTEIYYGAYVIDNDTSEMLPIRNILDGITGEFISINSKIFKEYSYVGCPIDLYNLEGEKELFVDVEQIVGFNWETVFLYNGYKVVFDDELTKVNIKFNDSIEEGLYNGFLKSMVGKMKTVIKEFCPKNILDRKKNAVTKKITNTLGIK